MSSARELKRDREAYDKRFSIVSESQRKSCQENYDVNPVLTEDREIGYGTPGFNVKAPRLQRKGEER